MVVYGKYVSAFKEETRAMPEYGFSDAKLIPLLKPWVSEIDRSVKCLDLGCGHGNILHALRTMGFRNLHGVDISEEQVEIARKNFPGTECMGIFEKMRSIEPGSLGLVTLFDVIEHLTKPEILDLLALVEAGLSPGGKLIVHCPNGESPFVGSIKYGDFTHETILSPQSARHICTLCGLHAFEAREHLGASQSVAGKLRGFGWLLVRMGMMGYSLVETGAKGEGILTRNFCFKVEKKK
jgi:SAM-dependent methyltransferase